jgi:hypothetical protein
MAGWSQCHANRSCDGHGWFMSRDFHSIIFQITTDFHQVARIAQWYSAELRQGLGIFLFTTASRPALGPTQPPIQWVKRILSLEVKRTGREADHSHPSSAEVKEFVELHFHSPNTPSWRGAQLQPQGHLLPLLISSHFTLLQTLMPQHKSWSHSTKQCANAIYVITQAPTRKCGKQEWKAPVQWSAHS